MNQGGNQGDDSTGQHYSVTEHTLHMLIRTQGDGERKKKEEGEEEKKERQKDKRWWRKDLR